MQAPPPLAHLLFRETLFALEEDEDAQVGLGVWRVGRVEGGECEGMGLGGGFCCGRHFDCCWRDLNGMESGKVGGLSSRYKVWMEGCL